MKYLIIMLALAGCTKEPQIPQEEINQCVEACHRIGSEMASRTENGCVCKEKAGESKIGGRRRF